MEIWQAVVIAFITIAAFLVGVLWGYTLNDPIAGSYYRNSISDHSGQLDDHIDRIRELERKTDKLVRGMIEINLREIKDQS